MTPSKIEFDEWRDSFVGAWFFDALNETVKNEMLSAMSGSMMNESCETVAMRYAERVGYIAGVLSVESLTYEDLVDAS